MSTCIWYNQSRAHLFLSSFCMTSPRAFLLETYDELQKVVWPTRDEVVRLTIIVIFISVAVGLYIGGLDYVFTKLMGLLLG